MRKLSILLLSLSFTACQGPVPVTQPKAVQPETHSPSSPSLPSPAAAPQISALPGPQQPANLSLKGRILMPSGVTQQKNGILMPSGIVVPSGILMPSGLTSGFQTLQQRPPEVPYTHVVFRIEILDQQGHLVQSGSSDPTGQFGFTLPRQLIDYQILVEAEAYPDFEMSARASNSEDPDVALLYVEIGPRSTAIDLIYAQLQEGEHTARNLPLGNFERVPELVHEVDQLEKALIPVLGLRPLGDLGGDPGVLPVIRRSLENLDALVAMHPELLHSGYPLSSPSGAPEGQMPGAPGTIYGPPPASGGGGLLGPGGSGGSGGPGGLGGPAGSFSGPSEDLEIETSIEGLGLDEFQVNSETAGEQGAPVLARDGDGDFVIVWQSASQDGDGYGIYAQRYDSLGLSLGGEIRVNTQTADEQRNPAVAMDTDGNYLIVWESYSQASSSYELRGQRYDSTGSKAGGEFLVNTQTLGQQTRPAVALDADGDAVVAWQSEAQDGDDYGIFARRFDSTGNALGDEFGVNSTSTAAQSAPDLAIDSDGDFVIVWQSQSQDLSGLGVYAQRFQSDGAMAGGEFRANSTSSGDQSSPAVAQDNSGDFVVSWASANQDGSGSGIYARRYNLNGNPQSAEFRVNNQTPGNQASPAMAIDSAGDFNIVWQSEDGDGYGIYAKRYSSLGVQLGPEFFVNTETASNQTAAKLVCDSEGNFAIVWESAGQDASAGGVFAKIYTADGQGQ